ncbi:MAG: tetratricopeptide repeat protein [Flavobacteriales bacterium]
MKRLMILLAVFLYAGTNLLKAQEYEDLAALWVDQKYEKLADKAFKYTEKDKSKNDPLPYLYLAKALYRISLDEKLRAKEEFKKSEAEALSYSVKYKKKDKNGIYKVDADKFFAEMKKTYFEQTENYYESGDFKKALAILKKVVQFDPENPGAWIVKAICEFEMKNKTEAVNNANAGVDFVKKIQNFNDLLEPDQDFMRFALMAYANYLVKTKDVPNAKKIISLGYQYYSKTKDDNGEAIKGNEDYVALYNKLVNG